MNIFLSYPVLGKPELNSMFSLYQSILTCKEHRVRLYANLGDSLIQRVRNVHLSVFLHEFPECDYFMSIDSDLNILNSLPSNNIFSKLIAHDKDFVGGLYAIKKQGVRRSSSITMDGTQPQFNSGLAEMRWLSSGCWCIKRSAVEKMYEAYKDELLYIGDDNAAGKKIIGLYNCIMYDLSKGGFKDIAAPGVKLLSEDWSLCQRWLDLGGKIYADTSIALSHIGSCDYNLWDVEPVKVQKPNLPPAGFDLAKV